MLAQNKISNFVPQFGGMKLEKQAKFRSWCPFKGFQGKINLTSIFSLLIQCVPSTVLVTRIKDELKEKVHDAMRSESLPTLREFII